MGLGKKRVAQSTHNDHLALAMHEVPAVLSLAARDPDAGMWVFDVKKPLSELPNPRIGMSAILCLGGSFHGSESFGKTATGSSL
jgi:hypothetical protein